MSWVIDASIAVKWVIPEVLGDEADRVRDGEADVLAPDVARRLGHPDLRTL